ncbi:MAG: apolipoprotein N-acyltransferase [Actinobacteria bacterium]|nr:apolipoprotein N-acyltransferase [Actinomycetota bacterium]
MSESRRERPILPLWAAVLTAIVAGFTLDLAFPDVGWWPMAFVAVVFALVSIIGRRVWSAVLVGFAFGAPFFLMNVVFTARYLGPVPWLALSLFEAALTAIATIPIALAYGWIPRLLPARWVRLTLLPLLVGGLWTVREMLVGNWPYGGFPWGRVGITQADGPFSAVASWVGVSGLSFLIVAFCAALIEYVRSAQFSDLRTALPTALIAVLLIATPQFPTTAAGTMRVGSVQGNGPSGYFDERPRNGVLNAQLKASAPLFGEQMDVLLWPEGSVDSDPSTDAATAAALDALSAEVNAPLIVNTVTGRGDQYFNTSMLWRAGEGATATYDKRHPVPFGEYVPDRWFFRMFAPDLIDLIQREYTPGTAAPLFDVNGVGVGLAICFDVIYDDVVWDAANQGAQVYMFQTNNADFRGTDENLQQLAFARMRAIETGRSVVNLSTVGTSQVIGPDGSEIAGIPADTAGDMLTDVPLRTGLTPAAFLGPVIPGVIAGGSLAVLLALGAGLMWRRRHAKTPAPEGTGVSLEG